METFRSLRVVEGEENPHPCHTGRLKSGPAESPSNLQHHADSDAIHQSPFGSTVGNVKYSSVQLDSDGRWSR